MSKRNVKTSEAWTDREGKQWPVEVTAEECPPKLVVFGCGRTTIHYTANHRCEGYDHPEDFFEPSRWWTHDHAERKGIEQWEGVPYVDLRAAVDHAAGYKMVINGPMVDVDLEPGEVERLPEPDPIMAGAMAFNSYGTLLTLQKAARVQGKRAGPLDSVSIAEYLDLWREAGATVGVIRNGQFMPR